MKNYQYILTHSSGNLTLEYNPIKWNSFNMIFNTNLWDRNLSGYIFHHYMSSNGHSTGQGTIKGAPNDQRSLWYKHPFGILLASLVIVPHGTNFWQPRFMNVLNLIRTTGHFSEPICSKGEQYLHLLAYRGPHPDTSQNIVLSDLKVLKINLLFA